MTENRKEELEQLLHEAIANLEVQYISEPRSLVPPLPRSVHEYQTFLQQEHISLDNYSIISECVPYIANRNTHAKLFNFLREEFSGFLMNGSCIISNPNQIGGLQGTTLDILGRQLLKMALTFGVEKAIILAGECIKHNRGNFQRVICLEGIRIDSKIEIEIFRGVRLISVPNAISELPHHLQHLYEVVHRSSFINEIDFFGKTMLVIDYTTSPIFFNQNTPPQEMIWQVQIKENNKSLSKFNKNFFETEANLVEEICQALSLTYGCAVQRSYDFEVVANNELFKSPLGFGTRGVNVWNKKSNRQTSLVKNFDKEKFDDLYVRLTNLNSGSREHLQVPIDRWIKSYTDQNDVDKIVDLAIALESLYLSNIPEPTELSFRLRLHAAWYLRKKIKDRKELMKDISQIYEWRSAVVHKGKLPKKRISKKKKRPYTQEEITELITTAQDLCWETIIKILKEGKFPDWNNLILGDD